MGRNRVQCPGNDPLRVAYRKAAAFQTVIDSKNSSRHYSVMIAAKVMIFHDNGNQSGKPINLLLQNEYPAYDISADLIPV